MRHSTELLTDKNGELKERVRLLRSQKSDAEAEASTLSDLLGEARRQEERRTLDRHSTEEDTTLHDAASDLEQMWIDLIPGAYKLTLLTYL